VFIVSLILTGLVLGALARFLVPGRDPMSLPMTLLLGIVGAIVGGLIGKAIFDRTEPSFLLALVTTIGLLLVLRKTGRGRRSTV